MAKFLFVSTLLLIASVSAAGTMVFDPVADSPLFELFGNTNYGDSHVGYWGFIMGHAQRTLILYDLSPLNGMTVVGAQLSWEYYENETSGSANMWACKVTGGTWDEMSVTWETQPAYDDSPSGRILDIPWDTGSGVVTYNCTAEALPIIQAWVDNPSSNYGLLLRKDPESGDIPRCYPYMRDDITQQAVQLIVEYSENALAGNTMASIKASFR